MTGELTKRLDYISSSLDSFSLLAQKADVTATHIMQTILKDVLKNSLEDRKREIDGGLKGVAISAVSDIFDTGLKVLAKKPNSIRLPNISNLETKTRKLEERFAMVEKKITSLGATKIFQVLKYLQESGLESALDYILENKVVVK